MTASGKTLEKIGGLALVGAGKMGGAMLEGWLALGLDPRSVVDLRSAAVGRDPRSPREAIALNPARTRPASRDRHPRGEAAGRPRRDAVRRRRSSVRRTLVISIMAGKTLAFCEAALPNAAIVRAMPNTPAAIGRGITVAVPNARVTPAQREIATDLLAATGAVEWIDDEALMDAVTAVSGSGPAYVFLLAEALAQAGIAAGLPNELAEKLARETVAGSGRAAASLAARSGDLA